MINLDYQSRTPIYEQIINEIEKFVSLGILKPKEQILSITGETVVQPLPFFPPMLKSFMLRIIPL